MRARGERDCSRPPPFLLFPRAFARRGAAGAMGKQRSKDRAYISASEWATEWGGRKDRGALPFSRLPFHCCALTFTPFGAPRRLARS